MTRLLPPVYIVLLLLALTGTCRADDPPTTRPSGFAVVELFTSEGCSSCPPAERVANRVVEKARNDGAPVYVIAYHVDYWDRLGWPDRFAKPTFSERQRRYAQAVSEGRVYTPQMIVNGRVAFVGSDAKRAEREIGRALDQPAAAQLRVTDIARPTATRITASLETRDATDVESLVVVTAIVEDGLTTRVKRGENAGRDLHHDAVARGYATTPVPRGDSSIDVTVDLPSDLITERATFIAYLQDPRTMRIVAAVRHDLRVRK